MLDKCLWCGNDIEFSDGYLCRLGVITVSLCSSCKEVSESKLIDKLQATYRNELKED